MTVFNAIPPPHHQHRPTRGWNLRGRALTAGGDKEERKPLLVSAAGDDVKMDYTHLTTTTIDTTKKKNNLRKLKTAPKPSKLQLPKFRIGLFPDDFALEFCQEDVRMREAIVRSA